VACGYSFLDYDGLLKSKDEVIEITGNIMEREQFLKTKRLYHYTKFQSAVKILDSMSLKFASLDRMNDINERYRPLYIPNSNDTEIESFSEEFYKQLSHVKQISLTRDIGKHYGFDIPAMWGHYAEMGEGVCFILDKEKIEKEAKLAKYICSKVTYLDTHHDFILDTIPKDIPNYFYNQKKELFFTKTKDWSYEQEFRILELDAWSKDSFLNIRNALIAIVLYDNSSQSVFGMTKYKLIKAISFDIPILEYSNTNLWGTSLIDEDGNCNWIKEKE
jgi:hypothetical protein